MLKLISIFITSLLTLTSLSQEDYFTNYNVSNGLPSNNVYCVNQDEKGNILIGTDRGISIFDSYDFQNFGLDDNVADLDVFEFHSIVPGQFYYRTFNGKLGILENNKHERITLVDNMSYLSDIEVVGDEIFVSGIEGEVIKIVDKKVKKSFKWKESGIFGMYSSSKGLHCIGVAHILLLSKDLDSISVEKTPSSFAPRSRPQFGLHYVDDECQIFSMYDRVTVRKKGKDVEVKLAQKSDIIHVNKIDGVLFVGTRKGLFAIDLTSWPKLESKNVLENHAVSNVFRCQENNLWISTLNSGVYKAPFDLFKQDKIDANLGLIDVRALYDDGDDLWIGSSNSCYIFRNQFGYEKFDFKSIHTDPIQRIKRTGGELWILSKVGCVLIREGEHLYYNLAATDIIKHKSDYLFAKKGLYKFPRECFSQYNSVVSSSGMFRDIFANLQYGVIKNGRISRLYSINEREFGVSQFGFYSLSKDESPPVKILNYEGVTISNISDTLLLGTRGKGVFLYKNGRTIDSLRIRNGKANLNLVDIAVSDDHVYLAYEKKIYRSPRNNLHQLRDVTGLLIPSFRTRIQCVLIDGNDIKIGTNFGLIEKSLDSLSESGFTYHLSLSLFYEDEQVSDNREFSYLENNFKLKFKAISFNEDLEYYYRIVGLNSKWKRTSNREIELNGLPSGNYAFQVYAKGSFGKSPVSSIEILIIPPVWKRTWFILSIIALGILLFYVLIRLRWRNFKKKQLQESLLAKSKQEKAELELVAFELEHKALRLQMNPHFIFNALNTIKGFYAENNYMVGNDYIVRFSKLIRNILENSAQIISLEKEIEMVESYVYLFQLKSESKLNFSVVDTGLIAKSAIGIPPMLIQPFIENSLIHAVSPDRPLNLKLKLTLFEEQLKIEVVDDGIGVRNSSALKSGYVHKSISIELTKERIQMFSKQLDQDCYLTIDEHEPSLSDYPGTSVTLVIPMQYVD